MISISRVTINDIAKQVGVSANTVSKALNGKPKVSAGLRAEIMRTAQQLGYVKNINAQRLAKKDIRIGVLVNGFDENYYRYTEKGLKKAADFLADRKVIVDIRVIRASADHTEAFSVLRGFLADGCSGVIINDLYDAGLLPLLEEYRRAGIRYAFLNGDIKHSGRSFAMENDYLCAASLAAEVLCLAVDPDKALAVYSLTSPLSPQNKLASAFCEKAADLGRQDVRITENVGALFATENLGGIYVSHASYLEVCRHLRAAYPKERRPKLIVSDLYEESVPYIEDGTITALIYQEPEEQAFLTVVRLCEWIGENKPCADVLTIKPVLIMKSNYKKYL